MIFIVWPKGGDPIAVARPLGGDGGATTFALPEAISIHGDEAEVFALGYRCPLASMELAEGLLDLSVDARLETRLPVPHQAFFSELSDDRAEAWQPIAALDARLERLSLKNRGIGCPSYQVTNVAMSPDVRRGLFGYVMADADESALVGMENGDILRVTPDSLTPLEEYSGLPSAGGYRDRHGDSYFYGNGKLIRVRAGEAPEQVAEISLADSEIRKARMSGPYDDSPFELFIVDFHLRVLRFDGFSLRELVPASTSSDTPAGIQWIGSGEAIAALNKRVLWLKTGEEPRDITPTDAPDEEYWVAGYSPGLGPLLGSNQGHLRVREGDAWRVIDGLPGYWQYPFLSAIAPYDRGAVLSVVYSYLSTYDEERGYCRIDGDENSYKVLYAISQTCSGFVAYGNERNDAPAVYFYRRL